MNFKKLAFVLVAALAMTACSSDDDDIRICNFEGATWNSLIPTEDYNDSMIYAAYGSSISPNYTWYDSNTGLAHEFPKIWGNYNFMGGGIVISNKVGTDLTAYGSYEYELRVPTNGGYRNSKNFAVVHCDASNNDVTSITDTEGFPSIYFADGADHYFNYMYVCPTTYTLNVEKNGNYIASAIDDTATVQIKAFGYNAAGKLTGTSTFYLADGKNYIVADWTLWDLTSLGACNRVYFNMVATGTAAGSWGMNIPAYFAFDNVQVTL